MSFSCALFEFFNSKRFNVLLELQRSILWPKLHRSWETYKVRKETILLMCVGFVILAIFWSLGLKIFIDNCLCGMSSICIEKLIKLLIVLLDVDLSISTSVKNLETILSSVVNVLFCFGYIPFIPEEKKNMCPKISYKGKACKWFRKLHRSLLYIMLYRRNGGSYFAFLFSMRFRSPKKVQLLSVARQVVSNYPNLNHKALKWENRIGKRKVVI